MSKMQQKALWRVDFPSKPPRAPVAPPILLKRLLSLALSAVLVVGGTLAQDADPEPPGGTKEEAASPAVDLEKAKGDAKLAAQAARNLKASKDNLSHIGLALHSYYDAHRRLPSDITDKKGKALLSWRVALLPYLPGGDKLHKEFRPDEPWDSRHNVKLLGKMPGVFRSPRVKVRARGSTVYQVFTGPDAVFGRVNPLTLPAIPDGTSNTIMAVESSSAVPWTKPADIPFDRRKALPDFGKAYGKKPLVVMFDGSARLLDLMKIKAETLKNAIDPADGNTLGKDWADGAEG
jgi:hypothetical protein